MNKIMILLVFLFVSFSIAFAQNKVKLIGFGVNLSMINDLKRNWLFEQEGITANMETYRLPLVFEVYYSINTKFYMKSAVGATFYNSDLRFGPIETPLSYSFSSVMSEYLALSQTAFYNLYSFPRTGIFKIKISPFMSLGYDHLISKGPDFAHGQIVDFTPNHFDDEIPDSDNLMTYRIRKTSVGILSLEGGLSLDIIIKNFGINYSYGYAHTLFGHSQFCNKYKYMDDEIHSLNLKTRDSGFMWKFGLRYYFKN